MVVVVTSAPEAKAKEYGAEVRLSLELWLTRAKVEVAVSG